MLDRRLNAFRPDLAEKSLEGQVDALRFIEGTPARVIAATTAMRPDPRAVKRGNSRLPWPPAILLPLPFSMITPVCLASR